MARFYYFIIIPIAVAAYLVYAFFKTKAEKERVANWLNENPNAAKVYIAEPTSILGWLFSIWNRLNVISVDGQHPLFFREKLLRGFYVAAGTHVVESTFSTTRPGFFYRTVTTTYGPSKQEITVDSARSYNYSFDKGEKNYRFEQINEADA